MQLFAVEDELEVSSAVAESVKPTLGSRKVSNIKIYQPKSKNAQKIF